MKDIWEKVTGRDMPGFLRSVGILVGGTAFAQAIMVLALPIITRLYSPGDFSMLAVFNGLVSIISVAACLRFDVATPISEHDSEAANVLALALTSALAVTAILAALVFVFPNQITLWLNQPDMNSYIWLLPLAILLSSVYSALQYWFVRKRDFGVVAKTRVVQSCAAASTQLGLGWLHYTPLGLILGQIFNNAVACLAFGYRSAIGDGKILREVNLKNMRAAWSAHANFPKYSTFEALSNSAGLQLPVIIIAAVALGPEAGYLALAMYAMQAPIGLISNAVSQVYLSRAPFEHRASQLSTFTTTVFGGLVRSGVGPLLFAGIVAPSAFALIFGEEWRRAGILVAWLTPCFVLQYLAAPVSMALHITNNQKSALILQLLGLVLRTGSVYIASLLAVEFIAEAYALSGFVFYLVYIVVVLHTVNATWSELAKEIRKALPAILQWSIGGCLLGLALSAIGSAITR